MISYVSSTEEENLIQSRLVLKLGPVAALTWMPAIVIMRFVAFGDLGGHSHAWLFGIRFRTLDFKNKAVVVDVFFRKCLGGRALKANEVTLLGCLDIIDII